MQARTGTRLFLPAAVVYSILLFFIANYLPLLTNGLAEMLTWAVYSQIVRGLVIFMGAVFAFVVFVRITLIPRPILFLIQLIAFGAATSWFFSRLGDSVNEYIHYPQYAACVLIWYAALDRMRPATVNEHAGVAGRLLWRLGVVRTAMIVSGLLGLAEGTFQHFAPRRAFDLQDILLNLMGVWLGAMLIWIFKDRK